MGCSGTTQKPKDKNVIFIIVDDLKPLLNHFGETQIVSPNMDRLAKSSVSFTSAYCQQAFCTASRMSFLTGMRPDYTKVWDLSTKIRDVRPDIVTIPEYFKNNGYQTAGMGKVMHGAKRDDPQSWTIPFINNQDFTYAEGYQMPANLYQSPAIHQKWDSLQMALDNDPNADRGWFVVNDIMKQAGLRPSTEMLEVPDDAYADGAATLKSIELLNEFQQKGEKFFLTIGFQKPHLPFTAPKKYWDLYDRSTIKLAEFQDRADGGPAIAYHTFGELRNYHDIEPNIDSDGRVTDEKQRELIHGYYASVSYMDAQIGKLLDHLKSKGLDQNTVIVLTGDHGWHLGDHGLWNKHSNFEQATRTPLMIYSPDIAGGFQNNSPVELIDIFPTICDLAGIAVPDHLQGTVLTPILKMQKASVKNFAISQYPRRCNVVSSAIGKYSDDCTIMGYAIRDDRYRYVIWYEGNYEDRSVFNFDSIIGEELYDYEIDPLESKNLVDEEGMSTVRSELLESLKNVIWEN